MGFGKTLKALRESKGWSLREAATKARTSRQTVFRAEHDDAMLTLLLKLMRAYGVKGADRTTLLNEYVSTTVRQRSRPSA